MKNNKTLNIILATLIVLSGCEKSEFLNKKPNSNIVEPKTLSDFEYLLDNTVVMHTPGLGTISADEFYYANKAEYDALTTQREKNCSIWADDIYKGENAIKDWNVPYATIFYTNVVLEGISKLDKKDQNSERGKRIEGWALFNRAYSYFALSQTFCDLYIPGSNNNSLGLPLKLKADINEIKQRSSLSETYQQILRDLTASKSLLSTYPDQVYKNRPSKASAYGLLSRLYLFIGDFKNSLTYSDSSLIYNSSLIDFNTLPTASNYPIPQTCPEISLWTCQVPEYGETYTGSSSSTRIDTALLATYDQNDLRQKIFFRQLKEGATTTYLMKRGYNGTSSGYPFTGIATDEIYLNKAECLARIGQIKDAENTLNKLLVTRFITGTYIDYETTNVDQLIAKILLERRKELIWRGIRWNDLKRLNKLGANITLTRKIQATTYTLSPNSVRYTLPIPIDEITLSHIAQNPR